VVTSVPGWSEGPVTWGCSWGCSVGFSSLSASMVDREVRGSAEYCKKNMRRRLLMSNQGCPSSTGQADDAQRARQRRPDGKGRGEGGGKRVWLKVQSAECRVQTDKQGLTGPAPGTCCLPRPPVSWSYLLGGRLSVTPTVCLPKGARRKMEEGRYALRNRWRLLTGTAGGKS
jgi:hypothetical protein